MRLHGWLLIVGCMVPGVPARADGLKVEPGEWRFRTSSQTSAGEPAPPTVTTRCLSEPELTPKTFMVDARGCSVLATVATGSLLRWKMSCSTPDGRMDGGGDFSSTGTTVRGTMHLESVSGDPALRLERSWEATRLGPCD